MMVSLSLLYILSIFIRILICAPVNDAEIVECDEQPKCTETTDGHFLPFLEDCTKFIRCNHGSATVMSCGPGTHFNPLISNCDWPSNAKCKKCVPRHKKVTMIVRRTKGTTASPFETTTRRIVADKSASSDEGYTKKEAEGTLIHHKPTKDREGSKENLVKHPEIETIEDITTTAATTDTESETTETDTTTSTAGDHTKDSLVHSTKDKDELLPSDITTEGTTEYTEVEPTTLGATDTVTDEHVTESTTSENSNVSTDETVSEVTTGHSNTDSTTATSETDTTAKDATATTEKNESNSTTQTSITEESTGIESESSPTTEESITITDMKTDGDLTSPEISTETKEPTTEPTTEASTNVSEDTTMDSSTNDVATDETVSKTTEAISDTTTGHSDTESTTAISESDTSTDTTIQTSVTEESKAESSPTTEESSTITSTIAEDDLKTQGVSAEAKEPKAKDSSTKDDTTISTDATEAPKTDLTEVKKENENLILSTNKIDSTSDSTTVTVEYTTVSEQDRSTDTVTSTDGSPKIEEKEAKGETSTTELKLESKGTTVTHENLYEQPRLSENSTESPTTVIAENLNKDKKDSDGNKFFSWLLQSMGLGRGS